jgi:hypothetical protein
MLSLASHVAQGCVCFIHEGTTLRGETCGYYTVKAYEGSMSVCKGFGMVEPAGFEPVTPTMPLWCSTN